MDLDSSCCGAKSPSLYAAASSLFCMFALEARSSYVVLAVVEVRTLPASASSFEVREQTNKRERMSRIKKNEEIEQSVKEGRPLS